MPSLSAASPYAAIGNPTSGNKFYSKDLHILGMAKGSSIIVADTAKPIRRQANMIGQSGKVESTWRNGYS